MNPTESIHPLRSAGLPRYRRLMFLLLAMLAFCPPVTLFAQTTAYTVHALEEVVLDGTQYRTFANSVTNVADGLRLVAGYARRDNLDLQPVVWSVGSEGGSIHTLLSFPSDLFAGAGASEVNHHGQIIGNGVFDLASGGSLGLYWPNAASTPFLLPGLTGETSSQVLRINDSGVMVGISRDASASRAVAWLLADDSIVGPLVLPTRRRASGGNDSALGVGVTSGNVTSIVGASAGAAVVWRVKTVGTSLTLEGSVEVLDSTGQATGINSTGAICGNDLRRSVIWEPLSGKKRSKTLLNYNTSLFASPGTPQAITDGGMVVGSATLKDITGPAGRRVVIWTNRTAPMRTLESLTADDYPFLYLDTANAVNGDGEVVGYGWQGSPGGHQAFIALPGTP